MNKNRNTLIALLRTVFSRKMSITSIMAALSTTVALIAGHIIMVSAQLDDKRTLFIVAMMLLMLSYGVAWIVPRAISESLEEHSDVLKAMLTDSRSGGASEDGNQDGESATFRELAENVNEVFWVADETGEDLQYVSPAFEKTWGISLESLDQKRKTWIDTIHPSDRQNFVDLLEASSEKQFDTEFRIQRNDGAIRWVRARGFPVRDANEKVVRFVGIAEDITESKIVELSKTEFVSLASHQLRTPLSTLKWAMEVLNESTENFSDTQVRLLNNAQASMVRMSETINAMLTASRVQSDQVVPQTKEVNISTMLEEITSTYNIQAKRKKHSVKVLCPEDLVIQTDENILTEIVSNLVSNAIHYTPESGQITVEAKIDADKSTTTISVTDTGIGVPWEDQPMLFSKLFRGKNAMLVDTNGTGLGLYVTKSLTDALGGKIFFKSIENKGSSFSVQLPISGPQ